MRFTSTCSSRNTVAHRRNTTPPRWPRRFETADSKHTRPGCFPWMGTTHSLGWMPRISDADVSLLILLLLLSFSSSSLPLSPLTFPPHEFVSTKELYQLCPFLVDCSASRVCDSHALFALIVDVSTYTLIQFNPKQSLNRNLCHFVTDLRQL